MHDVSFIDVDEKLEGMAHNEDNDDANQNSRNSDVPKERRRWYCKLILLIGSMIDILLTKIASSFIIS